MVPWASFTAHGARSECAVYRSGSALCLWRVIDDSHIVPNHDGATDDSSGGNDGGSDELRGIERGHHELRGEHCRSQHDGHDRQRGHGDDYQQRDDGGHDGFRRSCDTDRQP